MIYGDTPIPSAQITLMVAKLHFLDFHDKEDEKSNKLNATRRKESVEIVSAIIAVFSTEVPDTAKKIYYSDLH